MRAYQHKFANKRVADVKGLLNDEGNIADGRELHQASHALRVVAAHHSRGEPQIEHKHTIHIQSSRM
jgi:hypothetical protein